MFEQVRKSNLVFKSPLQVRKQTVGIVLHHRAGWGNIQSEHAQAIAQGWLGVGYNYYIDLDGVVWEGRGMDKVGSHCGRKHLDNDPKGLIYASAAYNNSYTIGIGLEGYYHPTITTPNTVMPEKQKAAAILLMQQLIKQYPTIQWVRGHNEMPSTNTACPGNYFPLEELKAGAWYIVPKEIFMLGRVLKVVPGQAYMRGDDVQMIQQFLYDKGYKLPKDDIDGIYGPQTKGFVALFQKDAKITMDGMVGKQTIKAMGGVWFTK